MCPVDVEHKKNNDDDDDDNDDDDDDNDNEDDDDGDDDDDRLHACGFDGRGVDCRRLVNCCVILVERDEGTHHKSHITHHSSHITHHTLNVTPLSFAFL